jgi:phosphatidylglycerophosphatase A
MRSMRRDVRVWVVTLGGAGLAPRAPGTAGSVVTAGLVLAAYALIGGGSRPEPSTWMAVLLAGVAVFGLISLGLGAWACRHFGRADPPQFVLDEAAGVCLSMIFVPTLDPWRQAAVIALALAAFRFFDILKPPPVRQLEKLSGAWGILLDDLAAGVYANVVTQMVVRSAFA